MTLKTARNIVSLMAYFTQNSKANKQQLFDYIESVGCEINHINIASRIFEDRYDVHVGLINAVGHYIGGNNYTKIQNIKLLTSQTAYLISCNLVNVFVVTELIEVNQAYYIHSSAIEFFRQIISFDIVEKNTSIQISERLADIYATHQLNSRPLHAYGGDGVPTPSTIASCISALGAKEVYSMPIIDTGFVKKQHPAVFLKHQIINGFLSYHYVRNFIYLSFLYNITTYRQYDRCFEFGDVMCLHVKKTVKHFFFACRKECDIDILAYISQHLSIPCRFIILNNAIMYIHPSGEQMECGISAYIQRYKIIELNMSVVSTIEKINSLNNYKFMDINLYPKDFGENLGLYIYQTYADAIYMQVHDRYLDKYTIRIYQL